MDKVFLSILNMSLTASFVIVVVCLARVFLRRAPKFISYALWAVVLFHLICPFKFESAFSLIPFNAQAIPTDITTQAVPRINSGIAIVDNAASGALPVPDSALGTSASPLQIWTAIGAYVWLIGAVLLLIYAVIAYVRLKRRVSMAVRVEGNIYETDRIDSPFVLGFIRPRIYIPTGMGTTPYTHIIEHERTHIKRRDYLVSILAFTALALHWFNPLVWVAYTLMLHDMESSCDEAVLRHSDIDIRRDYSSALLSFSIGKQRLPLPPAFGEQNVKGRIKNVLKIKKTSSVTIITAAILAIAVFVGCAVNKVDAKYISYVYDNSDRNVKFSIEYPVNWKLIERRGWDGDETIEASPDTGIEFDFSENENETENFFIRVMLFSSLSFDREYYEQEDFITDDNLPATIYTRINEDESISVFYIFDEAEPPYYIAGINMSTAAYDKYKNDMQKVMKSFKQEQVNQVSETDNTEVQELGYIYNFNTTDMNFDFDVIEWITSEDTDRMNELNLNPDDDMPGGFYIYNPDLDKQSYDISDNVEYKIIDWEKNGHGEHTAANMDEFANHINRFDVKNLLCWITINNGSVIRITEQYVP